MKISDQELVAAVLSYGTNAEAAAALGISERAFYQRTQAESFQQLYRATLDGIAQACLERVQSGLLSSIEVISEIMLDEYAPRQVRLAAATEFQRSATRFFDMAQAERDRKIVKSLAQYAARMRGDNNEL